MNLKKKKKLFFPSRCFTIIVVQACTLKAIGRKLRGCWELSFLKTLLKPPKRWPKCIENVRIKNILAPPLRAKIPTNFRQRRSCPTRVPFVHRIRNSVANEKKNYAEKIWNITVLHYTHCHYFKNSGHGDDRSLFIIVTPFDDQIICRRTPTL